MARVGRDIWERRIQEWRRSGVSLRALAERIGCNPNSLAHWRWKLASAGRTGSERAMESPRVQFVEVASALVNLEQTDAPAEPAFEVVCAGGRVVRVPARFDGEALGRLLAVVERR